ncbi:aminotransferase class I/II-fold pyridoxal phosphate-dependent enzyme [Peptoniphilus catoniae]|uniref:aminotransferase class I/II-fold pyridoxal phosphate-dependent enzyme n=1 Tax=Peptoniphilus catoniae TaxID=1660341 RepID=UPI0010FD3941|nr:aminotransferase class I/II-fold pyridoxal phosphate-dependent enzyme [Peptoniphilus catoniae]
MNRYIFNAVKKVKDQVSFSMPGNKSNTSFDFDFKYDVTETIGTDNLLNPMDAILKSQEEIARVYGVKSSYYIPNGSTGALHVALSILTKPGDEIILQRNSHVSVYNSMILNSLKPHYIYPNYNKESNLLTGINIDELEKLLKNNRIKAVVLSSPNYFGICLRLKEISELVHKYKAYLIVDEAHGAHLKFSPYEAYSAVNFADIIVHSTHKTLPSLTQTALMHINCDIDQRQVLRSMKMFLSTSPSYILMLSSEYGVDFMDKNGRDILSKQVALIEKMEASLPEVNFFKKDDKDLTIGEVDKTKILFSLKGMKGYNIVKNMFLSYNIRLEMGDLNYALALSSVCNKESDFLKLRDALKDLSLREDDYVPMTEVEMSRPKIILNPREAFYRQRESIDIKEAEGRVCANFVSAYPPGVPLITPGEEITGQIISRLYDYHKAGIEIIGVDKGYVEVLK